jgi:hypothetical protein
VQCPSYLLRCILSSSTFTESIIYFYSSFLQIFGHLLGPRSFDSPEGPLVCKQVSFPIIFSGIKLISIVTITPTTYLRSWALVIVVITIRFIIDQYPFFLEALAQVDNNTSRWHMIFYHLWPMRVFFPFEQFIDQQMVQLQNSISERVHHHTLSNMFFNKTSKAHCSQTLSCSSPRANAWFIARPIYLTF